METLFYVATARDKFRFLHCMMAIAFFFCATKAIAIEIPLQQQAGVYTLPVRINGVITLNFVLDSGASEVVIPADVVMTLFRTGTIKESDFLPGTTYKLADGSQLKSMRFIIRELELGGIKITNVPGSISPSSGDLLLGQSLLGKIDTWTLDNVAHKLILGQRKSQPTKSEEKDSLNDPKRETEKGFTGAAIPPSKSIIPLLPNLPDKNSALIKSMQDGAKNGDIAKIEDAKVKLESMKKDTKCQRNESRDKNAAGLLAVSKEDPTEAAKNFYEAYLLCPNDVEALNNLGFALTKAGDYNNAEKALMASLALAPTRTNSWANLGQALSIKGDVDAGTACFLNAYRYSRNEKRTVEALQNLADYDPFPNTQQSARLALERLRKPTITHNRPTELVAKRTDPSDSSKKLPLKRVMPLPGESADFTFDNVQAYCLVNRETGTVLVLEGVVQNQLPQLVSFVLIEGRLLDANASVVQTRRCYLGNVLSRQEIENLRESDIQNRVMNRRGKDLVDVGIMPGSRISFMLIFNNLPENDSITSYSLDVISSRTN